MPAKFTVQAAWEDAPHLDEQGKAALRASYSPHELEARTRGVASMGAGAIYPVPEGDILCDPMEFPIWYRHVFALDVGWNRTACLWGALDPETQVLYLYSEYYRGMAEPPIHAEAIKSRGVWIPGVIDPAARGRSQKDGEQLFGIYQQLGLSIVPADNTVTGPESGIYKVWTYMSTGRLKVFKTLQNFRYELSNYIRDEKGKIRKEDDHLMDCLRYMVASGVALAAQRPAELWGLGSNPFNGMPIKKSHHQVAYSPLEAMWNPPSQNQSASGQAPRGPWMPHRT